MTHNPLAEWPALGQSGKRRDERGRQVASLRHDLPRLGQLDNRIAPVIVTPFTLRFTTSAVGNTVILGNTPETATTVGNPGRT
jgi:hypothetical protein